MGDTWGARMTVNVTAAQEAVCARFGMQPVPADPSAKVGISRSVQDGLVPLNGLRHRPEQGTTGWFIWAGENSPTVPTSLCHCGHRALR